MIVVVVSFKSVGKFILEEYSSSTEDDNDSNTLSPYVSSSRRKENKQRLKL